VSLKRWQPRRRLLDAKPDLAYDRHGESNAGNPQHRARRVGSNLRGRRRSLGIRGHDAMRDPWRDAQLHRVEPNKIRPKLIQPNRVELNNTRPNLIQANLIQTNLIQTNKIQQLDER
jgi:hypothetical protein